ncbi:MAG: hypothetical protein AAGJ50_14745, partial [Pseudomonadota bacterium]
MDWFWSLVNGTAAWREPAQHILAIGVFVAVWIWGRGPERACATIWVGWIVLNSGANAALAWIDLSDAAQMTAFQVKTLALDIYMMIGFGLVALYANRSYPIWCAGLQLISLAGSALRVFSSDSGNVAYVVMTVGAGWIQLLLIA